ncbi:MAG: ABC transporter permease [Clostridiales Family XIII bacterium]|jgi:NitT/TauT family transport system permease protein|nr:ABC transporter permease [Clostridiales Family XIII bacterium]
MSNLAKSRKFFSGIVPVLAFFALWEIGANYVPNGLISRPSRVFVAMAREFAGGELFRQTGISLSRILLGFSVAAVGGIVFGFALGTFFRRMERFFLPFFQVCEKLNPFAIIPVFMILFGVGTLEKAAVVFWASFWPVLFNTQFAAKAVDPQLMLAARSMGANRAELFAGVILPYTMPGIFTGLKLAVRVAFFMIIASEVIGASTGLGWFYVRSSALYKLDLMYGSILYITLLSILANFIFERLEKHFMSWKEDAFS